MSKFGIYQPWSAPVVHASLPDIILKDLLQLTDLISEDINHESSGNTLAGEIEDEWVIDPILLTNISFDNYIIQLCKKYREIIESQYPPPEVCGRSRSLSSIRHMTENLEIISSWFNNQKDNEYNPLHNHSGYFSGVLYLKIPKYIPPKKENNNCLTGSITFISNTDMTEGGMTHSYLTISPKVGDIFLFPSTLKHLVYPFQSIDGKGSRRSMSFNLTAKNAP